MPPGGVTDCRVAGYGGLLLLRHFAVYEGDPHQEPHGRHLVPGTHHSGSAGRGVNSALFFFFFSFSFSTSLSLAGISGRLIRVRHSSRCAALPTLISVCSIFVCPNNGMATSVYDF